MDGASCRAGVTVSYTRRRFLERAAAAAAAPLIINPVERVLSAAMAQPRAVFRHGVASGDPLTDGVLLWTRISGASPGARPAVRWVVARDEAFRQIAARGETA